MTTDFERLTETIRGAVIGADTAIDGPFGPRRVTYADYTASGRSLRFIEEFIQNEVLPLYANTHSESSGTGRQTTRFREDARNIIANAMGCTDEDMVLFCGSGATGAINKLIDALNIRIPRGLDDKYDLSSHVPEHERPVVFIGPYEHHANELPWRESLAELVKIPEDPDGRLDLDVLEQRLIEYQDRPLKIGSFSAASNVTGIGTDTRNTAVLLHKYGALSFWDFAAAGPYVQMEMNLSDDGPDGHLAYKDAIFISPHKFIGGPGTPGLLIAKRKLFTNAVPTVPAGGTVRYVIEDKHEYSTDPVRREEGGTPDIIGSIRAGLVFQLKEAVGWENIQRREHELIGRAIERWSAHPNIVILGNPDAWRLSIVSFMVRHDNNYLHYNFIVSMLNDLFGIQARGGCSCAGPYGHRLLGIDYEKSKELQAEVLAGCHGIRPGWIRMNFNYFISDSTFEYIVRAVELLATHGWKLLPTYDFCPESGLWKHKSPRRQMPLRMKDLRYRDGHMTFRSRRLMEPEWALEDYLEEAERIFENAVADAATSQEVPTDPELTLDFQRLRWFELPSEAHLRLRTGTVAPAAPFTFRPKRG